MISNIFIVTLLGNNFYTPTIDIKDTLTDNFEFQYLKSEKSLDISEVQKLDFTKTSTNNFSLGYTKSQLWIKLNLKNNSNKSEFIITVDEHFYEDFNLYFFDKNDNKWVKKTNGLFVPIKNREIKTNKLATKIKILPKESKTFYVELKGKYAYFGKLLIYESNQFYLNKQMTINIFYTYIFGIVSIISIFSLFLYIKLREKIYLFYLGYSFTYLIYTINISGMLAYFDLHYYVYKIHSTGAFTTAFLTLFSMEYLNLKNHLKYLNYFLLVITSFLFIVGLFLIYQYTPWNKVINNTVGIINILLIISSIIIYIKGYAFAKYYLFIMLILFTFIILFTLMVAGVLEYNIITRYGYVGATTFELIGFTLLLVNKYAVSKSKQIQYQNQLISIKTKQEKLLENEVKNRTTELDKSNKELSKLVKERELLLKEVFHRVKNNFHMIIGMLWFESKKHEEKEIFTELTNRIKSMSKLHEYLVYNSKDLRHIDINDYLNGILNSISFSYSNKNFKIKQSIEKIHLEFDEALNLGVIVNEVVSNSIKHNQELKENNIIVILETKDEDLCLTILDNSKEFSIKENKGLGLNLIGEFSKKLIDAKYSYEFGEISSFILTFKKSGNDK